MKLATDAGGSKWEAFWPSLRTSESVDKAIQQGVVASLICAAITTVIIVLAMTGVMQLFGIGPEAFFDVAIFCAIAFGIWKKSRVAALSGLLFYLLQQAFTVIEQGRFSILMILFTLFFVNSVRGTFRWHQNQRETASEAGP